MSINAFLTVAASFLKLISVSVRRFLTVCSLLLQLLNLDAVTHICFIRDTTPVTYLVNAEFVHPVLVPADTQIFSSRMPLGRHTTATNIYMLTCVCDTCDSSVTPLDPCDPATFWAGAWAKSDISKCCDISCRHSNIKIVISYCNTYAHF